MKDCSGGAFTIDLIAGSGLFVVLLAVAFHLAASSIAHEFTAAYATGLRPLAGEVSEMLVQSPGSPTTWETSQAMAREAAFVGLSDGRPGFLSADKVYALAFFNDSELARHLGLDDLEHGYGIRIEVSADDGSLSVAAGFAIDDGTADVCKCVRLVEIAGADDTERSGKLIVYLWRKYEGTAGTDR